MNADYKNVWWLKTILNFNLIETCIYTFSKAKEMKYRHNMEGDGRKKDEAHMDHLSITLSPSRIW